MSDSPLLPPSWGKAAWAVIGRSQNGRAFPSSDYSPSGTRLLRPGNLHASGRVVWTEGNTRHLPTHYATDFPSYLVGPQEIVMNLTAQSLADEFLGRVCMTEDGDQVLLNQRIARLTPIRMNPRFVFWVLKSPLFRRFVNELNTGSLIQHMFTSQLDDFVFPVPPLAEQERIVAAIEEQFSRLDAGAVAIERARKTLKRMRAAVLQAAVSGQLVAQDAADGGAAEQTSRIQHRRRFTKDMAQASLGNRALPPNWTVAYMEELAERITVGHVGPMRSEYVAEGVPFLRSQNVRPNRFDREGLKYISQRFHERLEKSKLLPGDVVVVRSGNVGTACVVPEDLGEANCADLVVIQRPTGIDPHFAAYYMNSMAQSYVRAGKVGVALTHFNTKSVAGLPVPVPPSQEQRRIVSEADRLLSVIGQMEALMRHLETRANRLRSSILSAAFSGKLVPQDPNDEPTSVLLERIAAECASANGHKPARKPRQEKLPL